MASMWKVTAQQTLYFTSKQRVLSVIVCRNCTNNRQLASSAVHIQRCTQNRQLDTRYQQCRHMSDGRKGFFSNLWENLKQEQEKSKDMKESLKKFREERDKLEQADSIKHARAKFEKVEAETMKGTEKLMKGLGDVKDKVSETVDDVSKTEFYKKSKEVTGDIGKTIYEQGKNIGETTAYKSVSSGVKAVKEEFDHVTLSKARPYRAPEKLQMRSEIASEMKEYEADDETVGVTLHKDFKWSQSWENFKDNNKYVNKVFDLKMRYDESDHRAIRATRFVTDKFTSLFGGMFSPSEVSEVMTEVCRVDPSFRQEKFMLWCQYILIPNILEALARGEELVVKDWCYEAPYNVMCLPMKQSKAAGLKIVNNILDVSVVDLAAAKMMEQGPVLVIRFQSQQTIAAVNKKGDVVEGNMDKIMRVVHVWALCRDQNELNPDAAWKVLDVSQHMTEQFL